MSHAPSIMWFRQDLRLDDNPALREAARDGRPVVALWIWHPEDEHPWAPGGASRWWLHHSISALSADLAVLGVRLIIRAADPAVAIAGIAGETGARSVHAATRYEPWAGAQERRVADALASMQVSCSFHPGLLLHDPSRIRTGSGVPYKVYTPFSKSVAANVAVEPCIARPSSITAADVSRLDSAPLESLRLLPRIAWDGVMEKTWTPGEAGARERLAAFVPARAAASAAIARYATGRDEPGTPGTSMLSPHLHWGEISPRRVWNAVDRALAASSASGAPQASVASNAAKFKAEIVWREFAYHVLSNFPATSDAPLRPEFSKFPWSDDAALRRAWERGRTGYPLVDAGMRELWATGWMHNRVRMSVSSFLVKHLLQHWMHGAHWFWDTLVDADLASNSLGWQWSAGCGADAAPYFRIFNPVLQGEKFDPDGAYVRRWVPELARVPAKWIHRVWEAPADVLASAGVTLGTDYPSPIVDHAQARARALKALTAVSKARPAT
jgi:deoxyribodipyrimidine photo-lyase